jgi:pimeloyl-ACP methyl ester carboxylesterase
MIAMNPLTFLPHTPQLDRPLLILVAGMDSTGKLMHRQARLLQADFDVRCLAIPLDDCSPWEVLTQWAVERVLEVQQQTPARPVFLCGESFGACLALNMVCAAPDLCDRLILVNSASAFGQQSWLVWGSQVNRWFPAPLHRLSAVAAVAILSRLERLTARDRQLFVEVVRTIPQTTSHWRFSLLRQFQISDADLRQIHQPTLVIASARDAVLPSIAEAQRLAKQMPAAQVVTLPDSGHSCLIEASFSLLEIMQDHTFQ